MFTKKFFAATAAMGVLALANTAGAHDTKKENPKLGKTTYYGSGFSERAPEFAEVHFNFAVRCKSSADAVTPAIASESNRVWHAIVSKVTEKDTSEKVPFSPGDPAGIQAQPSSRLEI